MEQEQGVATNIKELVRSYYEMWNEGDFKKADKLMHDDIQFLSSLGDSMEGLEAFKSYAAFIMEAFPDLYHAVEILISEGNRASAYVMYTGVHKGKLFNIEPTKKRIRYNGATFFTIDEGKIAKIRVLGDRYTLYRQLGVERFDQTENEPAKEQER